MGFLDKFKKKKFTKDEKKVLESARQELKKSKEDPDEVEIVTNPKEIARLNKIEEDRIKKILEDRTRAQRKEEFERLKREKEEEKILAQEGNSYEFSQKEQSKTCCAPNCNEDNLHSLNSKNCKLCGKIVCDAHILPENHECVKHIYVKFLRKKWLRKYGLNVSTGRYTVSCDQCNYRSEIMRIEDAGEKREFHIKNGCDSSKVFLELMDD
jgi:hypothetical protein